MEIPQSISVITADRMEQLRATTLNEALNYTAGVRPNLYGSDSRYDWVSIRGFDAYFPGFYFDGLFARNNNTWAVWRVEPYGAERIEVLKGPSSVLYGQTNPGGLINVVTKRPTEEPIREVEMLFGNRDQLQPAFDIGDKVTEDGKVRYRITGLGLTADTDVDFADRNEFFIAPGVTWRPSADTSLTVLGQYIRYNSGIDIMFLPAEGSLLPNPNGNVRRSTNLGEPNFDGFDQTQWMVSYFLDHRINDVWSVPPECALRQPRRSARPSLWRGARSRPTRPSGRLRATPSSPMKRSISSSSTIRRRRPSPPAASPTRCCSASTINTICSIRSQVTEWRRRSTCTLPFMATSISRRHSLPTPRPRSTQTGVYMQEQAKFYDRLVLVAGGRYDWAENKIDDQLWGADAKQNDEAFSWRVGGVYLGPERPLTLCELCDVLPADFRLRSLHRQCRSILKPGGNTRLA